jgi:hypothetical protein
MNTDFFFWFFICVNLCASVSPLIPGYGRLIAIRGFDFGPRLRYNPTEILLPENLVWSSLKGVGRNGLENGHS